MTETPPTGPETPPPPRGPGPTQLDATIQGPGGGRVSPRTGSGRSSPVPPTTVPSRGESGRQRATAPAFAGRYRLGKELGRGGIGVVQAAIDNDLRREVAVKRLHTTRGRRIEMFIEEAQITGQLEHPNIIPLHDIGTDAEGRPWLAMKKVLGLTLTEHIQRDARRRDTRLRGPDLTAMLDVFLKVCDAIAFAHSRGVIHRDLKPDNIMIGEFGEVMVMDWGLAKPVGRADSDELPVTAGTRSTALRPSGSGTLTSTGLIDTQRRLGADAHETVDGAVQGTPGYMPPEQAAGETEKIGFASDVFALGAVLYHMLTLQVPYQGKDVRQLLLIATQRRLDPPRRRAPARGIPVELDAIVMKAMAKRPQDRYARVHDLADDLRAWRNHLPIRARKDGPLTRLRKWSRRNPTGTAVLAVTLVFLLVGGAVSSVLIAQASEAKARADAADVARVAAEREAALEARARAQAEQLARVRDLAQRGQIRELQSELDIQLLEQRGEVMDQFDARLAAAREQGITAVEFLRTLPRAERGEILAAFDRVKRLHEERPDAITYSDDDRIYHAALLHFHHPSDPRPLQWLTELVDRTGALMAIWLRGILRHNSGDHAGAEKDYTRALELAPGKAELWANRSLARASAGNIAGAEADARQALEIRPDYLNARFALANTLYVAGRFEEAIPEYTQVAMARPGHELALIMRARCYMNLRQLFQAMRDYENAIRYHPDEPRPYMERAAAYESLNQYDKAVEDYGRAIAASPQSADAWARRGACRAALGDHSQAMQDLQQAISLRPDHSAYHLQLGIVLAQARLVERARDAFAEAERTASSPAERSAVDQARTRYLGE